MTPEEYQKLKAIFQSAVEVSGEERARVLDEGCDGDSKLRSELERMLDSSDSEFLEAPVSGSLAEAIEESSNSSLSGQRIGHYNVVRKIGSGGMGDVYLAVDGKLGRRVAVKILPEEFTNDEDRLNRFQLEARAASALSHPNILTIHEVGEWEGTHYIATEYVEGETLRHYISRERPSLAESLEIGVQLSSAIAAAHEAGICHRDIKPENIMIRRDGIVKVVDFGLAKLTASPFRREGPVTSQDEPTVKIIRTEPGVIMGTVQYMSPEQTRGLPTDERSDIWSLGCVLYEMLAGRPPFEGENSADLIAEIVKSHPEPLVNLDDSIPERLDEIVGKSLEKKPDERYQTAKDLLIDLKRLKRRFDADLELERSNPRITAESTEENVTSGPNIISTKKGPKDLTEVNSAQYLYWGIKAHRWTTIGLVLFVIGLVGATALLVRYYWKEGDPNERRLAYANKIKLAAKAIDASNLDYAKQLLDELKPPKGDEDLRSFDWGYLVRTHGERQALQPLKLEHRGVDSLAFSPDGKTFASAGADNTIRLWNVATAREISTLTGHSGWLVWVVFSHDGTKIATGAFDSTAKVWEVQTGRELFTVRGTGAAIGGLAFSSDDLTLVGGDGDQIRFWDSSTGTERIPPFDVREARPPLVFSPDGKKAAARFQRDGAIVWNIATRTSEVLAGQEGFIVDLKFSPDSTKLLTGSSDGTAFVWGLDKGKAMKKLIGHSGGINDVAYSLDGKIIATGSDDNTIKIWDAEAGHEMATLKGHTDKVRAMALSADGRKLASGSEDQTLRLWSVPQAESRGVLRGHTKTVNSVTFSSDSKMLASASEDGTARIWDAESEQQSLIFDHDSVNVLTAAFSNDGKTLATGGPKTLKLWSTINGSEQRTIPTEDRVAELAFSADDRLVAAGNKVPIWDVKSGRQICSLDSPEGAWTVEFMKEPERLLTSGGSYVRTWDLKTCSRVAEYEGEKGFQYVAVYSKTRKPWAFQILNESRSLKLIDTVSGEEIASFSGHEEELWAADFTPDGKRLATADVSGLIKFWDVPTGHELLSIKANVGELSSLAISPDGKTLAAAGADGIVRLFRSTY